MAYIYLHRRNDTGEVFYVGKGTRERATVTKSRNPHWHNVVNKAGFTVEIIAKGLTDEEAYWAEVLLIEAHGGVENLTNVTKGGDAPPCIPPKELSYQAKLQWQDPDYRRLKSSQVKAQWQDPEMRRKMSVALSKSHTGRVYQKIPCEKCGKMVGKNTMHNHRKSCYNSVTKLS